MRCVRALFWRCVGPTDEPLLPKDDESVEFRLENLNRRQRAHNMQLIQIQTWEEEHKQMARVHVAQKNTAAANLQITLARQCAAQYQREAAQYANMNAIILKIREASVNLQMARHMSAASFTLEELVAAMPDLEGITDRLDEYMSLVDEQSVVLSVQDDQEDVPLPELPNVPTSTPIVEIRAPRAALQTLH